MSIELHVLKKTTSESRSITFKFDDSTPPECTARCHMFCHRPNNGYEVLLLTKREIDSFAVDKYLTIKITRVVTNSSL